MNKKNILRLIGIAFLAFLTWRIVLLVVKDKEGASERFGRPQVAVEVASVRYEPIEDARQFTGSIYPLYQYVVAPKVSGRIIRLSKRIGDWVDRGEVIAKIDDAEYQQAVLEADANLRISQRIWRISKANLNWRSRSWSAFSLCSRRESPLRPNWMRQPPTTMPCNHG